MSWNYKDPVPEDKPVEVVYVGSFKRMVNCRGCDGRIYQIEPYGVDVEPFAWRYVEEYKFEGSNTITLRSVVLDGSKSGQTV